MNTTPSSGKSSTGLEANLAGALAYLLGPITGILFLALEKDSQFVRFHAMQSTITFLALFVVSVVLGVIPILGWLVLVFVQLGSIVLWLLLMFKAFQGEKFKLPIVGDMAERQTQ